MLLFASFSFTSARAVESTPAEANAIAEEAFLYGLPMVMMYSIMNEYAIDKDSGQFKAPFNTIKNEPKVYTPADTAIITPNSDTHYSWLFLDLRAEPMVLCVPEIEKDRYYSVMLTSQYTFNFGYIGSRATGNGAGCYGVAGPSWTGATPVVDWPKIDKAMEKADPFGYLAFLLQFAPTTGPAAVLADGGSAGWQLVAAGDRAGKVNSRNRVEVRLKIMRGSKRV